MSIQPGCGRQLDARSYEDLASLKKFIKSAPNRFDTTTLHEIMLHGNYLTTGTAHKLLSDGVTFHAVSNIGLTEVTLVLSGDADNASTTGKLYTFVYQSNDGVSHTAVGTGTATLNGTPVAFVPAVSDFYCATSFTASAVDANVNVIAKVAAGATYATISTTALTATQAQLLGIGAVYGRSHTDHADGDAKIQYLDYRTPWGEAVKDATCTHTATSSDEIRFLKSDGTTTVKDFHRVVSHRASAATTANSHEFIITDADCGNLDGSSGDIYSVIDELAQSAFNITYYCPEGYAAWLGKLTMRTQLLATNLDAVVLRMYSKADGETTQKICEWYSVAPQFGFTVESPFPLEESNECYFEALDIGTAVIITVDAIFVEVKKLT